jgi:hypothetical protein
MICFNGGKYARSAGICSFEVDGEEVEAPVSPVTKCTSIIMPGIRVTETAIYLGRYVFFQVQVPFHGGTEGMPQPAL